MALELKMMFLQLVWQNSFIEWMTQKIIKTVSWSARKKIINEFNEFCSNLVLEFLALSMISKHLKIETDKDKLSENGVNKLRLCVFPGFAAGSMYSQVLLMFYKEM